MISVSSIYSPDIDFFSARIDSDPLKYTHHCPEMMTAGPNTTIENCKRRQSRGGGCYKIKCDAAVHVPSLAPIPIVMVGHCTCGKVVLPRAKLDKYQITEDLCADCAVDFRYKRTQENNRREYVRNKERRKKKKMEDRAKKRAELEAQAAKIAKQLARLET